MLALVGGAWPFKPRPPWLHVTWVIKLGIVLLLLVLTRGEKKGAGIKHEFLKQWGGRGFVTQFILLQVNFEHTRRSLVEELRPLCFGEKSRKSLHS